MSENSIPKNGAVCWRELATTDRPGAEAFYKEMFGWELKPSQIPNIDYTEIFIGGVPSGGMITMDEKWGAELPPPHWVTYLSVDNIEETSQKITANGGTICGEPFDVEGVGRIAMVQDPCGTYFAILQIQMPG